MQHGQNYIILSAAQKSLNRQPLCLHRQRVSTDSKLDHLEKLGPKDTLHFIIVSSVLQAGFVSSAWYLGRVLYRPQWAMVRMQPRMNSLQIMMFSGRGRCSQACFAWEVWVFVIYLPSSLGMKTICLPWLYIRTPISEILGV